MRCHRLLFFALFLVTTFPAAAAENESPLFSPKTNQPVTQLAPLIGNVFARDSVSLNGNWKLVVDQLDIGDASPLLKSGMGTNLKPRTPGEVLEFSYANGYDVTVPGDWTTQVPQMFWYRGIAWYQKEFEYQRPENKRVFLYFGGANFSKDVYLNGQFLASHRGGFTPFNIDVTDFLQDGENALIVKVNSRSGPDDVPTERNDWMNYGGLTREVLLLELPDTFVSNYHVQMAPASLDTIAGWVDVGGKPSGQQVVVRIPELNLAHTATTDENGRAGFEFEASPDPWSPGNPRLYEVQISNGDDTVVDQVGFRSLQTRGEEILLNGKPVFMRGISMHEESVLHEGRAYGAEDAATAIALIKELNGNFVRLAHYPHNEHMVRAADRAGLMIWAEIPVYHGINFSSEQTLDRARQQMSELINRDRNRASVVLWSIANETQPSDERNRFLAELAAHVRTEDDTRLVTAALLGFDAMESVARYLGATMQGRSLPAPAMTIQDPLGEIVDVIGYNQYMGWYVPNFMADAMQLPTEVLRGAMLKALPSFSLDTAFDKPLIISETGAGAKAGRHGEGLEAWTEETQAAIYEAELAMFFNNTPALAGLSPWVLKDFRAPYRMNTEIQNYWNRKGLVSESGEKKQAFYVLRDLYGRFRD